MAANSGFTTSQVRYAMNVYRNMLLQRATEFTFQNVIMMIPAFAAYEPFAALGAFPMIEEYAGSVTLESVPSFAWAIPQNIFKKGTAVERGTWETDQIGAVDTLISGAGLEVVQFYQRKYAYELVAPSNAALAPTSMYDQLQQPGGAVPFGTPTGRFTTTFDGKPFFSTQHTYGAGAKFTGTQSNILQGNLPQSLSGVDIPTQVSMIQQDIANVIIPALAQFRNTNNDFIYQHLDEGALLEFHVPPALKYAFRQAALNANSLVSATSNITGEFMASVKDSQYYAECPSIKDSGLTISPAFPNSYFVLMRPQYVTPFVGTIFNPMPRQFQSPFGSRGNVPNQGNINSLMRDAASLFPEGMGEFARYSAASTIIDQTFMMQGAQAIPSSIEEAFEIVPRWRGNIKPVYWQMGLWIVPKLGTGDTFPTW